MSPIDETLSREEVGALICTRLDAHGTSVVLCGGSVVSIYSENEYESFDLDFVAVGLSRRIDAAMEELGFSKTGRHWTHPKTPFWVEFPGGPVSVGDSVITEFAARTTRFGVLRLLRPTECVMDRLAAWIHWNDPQGLDQALAVARRHPVDRDRIETWARSEGVGSRIDQLRQELAVAARSAR